MVGMPTKRVGWVCECEKVPKNDLKCDDCHRDYNEIAGILTEKVDK